MITSPDVQTNYIFQTLQDQRDTLMVVNGTLTARVKELESQLEAITESTAAKLATETSADDLLAN